MSEQLNTGYMDVPRAYFAKADKHAKYGAKKFIPKNGIRLSGNKINILAFINTEHTMYGDYNRTTYSDFKAALGLCGCAVRHNLKELIDDNIIHVEAQSRYKIVPEFSGRENVRVYSFLLNEKINLGGKIKKLRKNSAMYLCEIAAFRLKNGNSDKPFIGGINRVAKTLNIPKSTAHDVIRELIDTKVIFVKSVSKDEAGNDIVKSGRGNSRKRLTGYVLNEEILKRIRKIEKVIAENAEIRKVKNIFKATNQHKRQPERGIEKNEKYLLAAPSVMSDEKKFAVIEHALKNNAHYQNLKREYKEVKYELFRTITKGDEAAEHELESRLETVLAELRVIMQPVAPPGGLPEEIERYIK